MNQFIWPIQVYYEDTDSGGMVYYANYLKFMERARTEWLRSLDIDQDDLIMRDQTIFAVRKVTVDYLHPGLFNDRLEVHTQVLQLGRASIIFSQEIQRPRDAQVICRGEVKIACIDATGKGIKVFSPAVYQRLQDEYQN